MKECECDENPPEGVICLKCLHYHKKKEGQGTQTGETMRGAMRLNLGCGIFRKEGFINADLNSPEADINFDANKRFPFPDNKFDHIVCDFMLHDVKNFVFTFNEMLRIGKNNAIIEIRVPCGTYETWTDPMARREFTEHTFDAWDSKTCFGKDVAHETETANKINIISVKKKRGKYVWFRVHGLHFIFSVKKAEKPA
jgi:hypothetical protein